MKAFMKQRMLKCTVPVSVLISLLCGCAGNSPAPSPSPISGLESTAPPTVTQNSPGPASTNAVNALAQAAAEPQVPLDGEGWTPMFNGRDLNGWLPLPLAGGGEAEVQAGLLVLNMGDPLTGARYTNSFPTGNYEIALDAMRVQGSDFFCGLTLPTGSNHCTLIFGGWGGFLVGVSSIDGLDASENEATRTMQFEKKRWYRIRARMTKEKIEAWVDSERVVNVRIEDRKISMRPGEIEKCKPVGLATFQTEGAFRNIRWRALDSAPAQ